MPRWQVEVTFQEARAHLGVETQRQWSDRAIVRTTPCLLALFSIVALLADRLPDRERWQAAARASLKVGWALAYHAVAAVRREIWREQGLATSACGGHRTKPRLSLPEPWAYALCHAA